MAQDFARSVDYYTQMLADYARNEAFAAAIARAVAPGAVVADAGTGSGLLAVLAARAGARRVYAVERVEEARQLAAQVFADNGVADRVELVAGDMESIALPEPVDVVVSETLGNLGIDEGIGPWLHAFCARNLKPGGVCIPQVVVAEVAPVCFGTMFTGAWLSRPVGVDLSAGLRGTSRLNPRPVHLPMIPEMLGPPQVLEEVEVGAPARDAEQPLALSLPIDRPGRLDGVIGWFRAQLFGPIGYTSLTPDCRPSWPYWCVPLAPPRTVAPGDRLDLDIARGHAMNSAQWMVEARVVRAPPGTCPSAAGSRPR